MVRSDYVSWPKEFRLTLLSFCSVAFYVWGGWIDIVIIEYIVIYIPYTHRYIYEWKHERNCGLAQKTACFLNIELELLMMKAIDTYSI